MVVTTTYRSEENVVVVQESSDRWFKVIFEPIHLQQLSTMHSIQTAALEYRHEQGRESLFLHC